MITIQCVYKQNVNCVCGTGYPPFQDTVLDCKGVGAGNKGQVLVRKKVAEGLVVGNKEMEHDFDMVVEEVDVGMIVVVVDRMLQV